MEDELYDYYEENGYQQCPKCHRSYDEADYDFQVCSKCGWDATINTFNSNYKIEPSANDYLNGDADILTGQWY